MGCACSCATWYWPSARAERAAKHRAAAEWIEELIVGPRTMRELLRRRWR